MMVCVDDSGTLGPLTQKLFDFIWTKLLFVPGSKMYLPNIIKNGDPSRGLVSYDPYVPGGSSDPVAVDVPQSSRCLACLSTDYPNIPIGKGKPTLVFENIELINLHAIAADGALSFPPGYQVQANVVIGKLQGQALPFTVQPHVSGKDSFLFKQNCCEPKVPKTGQCKDPKIAASVECNSTWVNRGTGTFHAEVSKMKGALLVTVDTNNLTISKVNKVNISFDPDAVKYSFKIDQSGGDLGREAMRQFVKAAINGGLAENMVQNEINQLADSSHFRDQIKKLINEALREALGSSELVRPASGLH